MDTLFGRFFSPRNNHKGDGHIISRGGGQKKEDTFKCPSKYALSPKRTGLVTEFWEAAKQDVHDHAVFKLRGLRYFSFACLPEAQRPLETFSSGVYLQPGAAGPPSPGCCGVVPGGCAVPALAASTETCRLWWRTRSGSSSSNSGGSNEVQ